MAIEKKQIDRVVRRIVEDYDPKAIIIFGAVAKGTDDDSDLDMIVVMDSDLPRFDRTVEVRFSLGILDFPMVLLVYTPEEFEERRDDFSTVVYEAVRTGVVVYGSA
ncbi:MAG: nucleotidyltransferase domain-containing protein [Candidatus Methanoplasma sp.]|jgi:predicted nucleotidyltransferase|nr:nucleotidyltransferase domain-containing protein [Candidatus Methanoplasma sp.]